jgi:hypothetical protein
VKPRNINQQRLRWHNSFDKKSKRSLLATFGLNFRSLK